MKTIITIVIIAGLGIYLLAGKKKRKPKETPEIATGQKSLMPEKKPLQPRTPNPVDTSGIRPMPDAQAQQAFLENLSCFKPLLNGLINDTSSKEMWGIWSDLIVTINNNELTALWQKSVVKPAVWLRILASWGLSYDPCAEFTGIKGRDELYETTDRQDITVGQKYKVLTPCWILTTAEGKKQVIKKGTVEPIQTPNS
ncbi:MAG: hypothetical protein IJ539_03505 [Prevotella sp.]|nr:hypothetical protein [Prevotella sp.]